MKRLIKTSVCFVMFLLSYPTVAQTQKYSVPCDNLSARECAELHEYVNRPFGSEVPVPSEKEWVMRDLDNQARQFGFPDYNTLDNACLGGNMSACKARTAIYNSSLPR